MNKSILHTPEGVRDIYNEEMVSREIILSKLSKLTRSYGYDSIKTPALEYLSVYYKDITLKRDKDLYKFFDKEGNTLVLRPDFTPSIARATTKYFTDDKVVRLFYEGNVFSNNKRYQGRLMESCQFGGELIGDASIDADAEIIALIVEALRLCELDDFVISIGHANIVKELIRLGEFDDDESLAIKEYISNRNIYDLEKFLTSLDCEDDLIKLFAMVLRMYESNSNAWDELLTLSSKYDKVHNSIQYLCDLADILKFHDVLDYVTFEPGSDSKFDYYTGIIFAGYTKGIGEPIVTGGRYDSLLANFGSNRPAIGFGIFIDALQKALSNQHIVIAPKQSRTIIAYSKNNRAKAIEEATKLRVSGGIAELVLVSDGDFDTIRTLYSGENITIMEIG